MSDSGSKGESENDGGRPDQPVRFHYGLTKRNFEGLTHEDSLIGGEPAGNCINWVLGHVVAARSAIFKLAGVNDYSRDQRLDRYGRGTEPLGPDETHIELTVLRTMLDDSQQRLLAVLAGASQEWLDAPIPEVLRRPPLVGNVGNALARLAAHESYHGGQIGLLRRSVGKTGAIR